MEGEAEQPLLGAGRDLVGKIEGHGAGAAVEADDAAGLLEHPQCVGVAGRDADERRPVEAGRDPLDVERVGAAALTGGRAAARRRRSESRPAPRATAATIASAATATAAARSRKRIVRAP